MKYLIYFPPLHFSSENHMSGSFLPFCLLILAILTMLLSRENIDSKTFNCLKIIQTAALGGAVVTLVHQFGESLVTGMLTAMFIGALFFLFTSRPFRSDVFLSCEDEEAVLQPLTLQEAGSSEIDGQEDRK